MNPIAEPVASAVRRECALCGNRGEVIHRHQRDRLFGAAGSWNFRRCADRGCGLIWLDPLPSAEELKAAYRSYYTHAQTHSERRGFLGKLLTKMEQEYWSAEFGYSRGRPSPGRFLGQLLKLFPLRRRAADGAVRHLRAVPQGCLLDVGCGSGEWLLSMRKRGWKVFGTDFDQQAVDLAAGSGLDVRCGTLADLNFAPESFDAITLSHVIEHVPDPTGTLAECGRLLKPGGQLVIYTPNGASLSHRAFKGNWRGLEPPRHLQIFSAQSLRRVLEQAGFQKITFRPIVAQSVVYESVMLGWGYSDFTRSTRRKWTAAGISRLFNLLELCLVAWAPSVADCINALAVKEARIGP
jgi:2-polyprenyl-3-methyl-5-hydroxy-6-metoxy-1,4-benzoquinol methylase